jgi:hypothetical protein
VAAKGRLGMINSLLGSGMGSRVVRDWIGISERRQIANTLGKRHRITYDEVLAYGLKGVTPHDKTAEELAELRKARDCKRKRLDRLKAGRKTRAEYLANFASSDRKRQPWIAAGMSRRTWYRRQSKALTPVAPGMSATRVTTPGTTRCHRRRATREDQGLTLQFQSTERSSTSPKPAR